MDIQDAIKAVVHYMLSLAAYTLLAVQKHLALGYRIAEFEDLKSFSERPRLLEVPLIKEESRIIVGLNGDARHVTRHRSRANFLSERTSTC